MKTRTCATAVFAAIAAIAAGCAGMNDQETSQKALEVMKASFNERGQAKLDRLNQDEAQKLCSKPPSQELAKDIAAGIEKANLASIRYPADGRLMGDWRQGERIAQSGIGKQFSDDPKIPAGANCYACHQLSKAEISYGTIGPSLYNYGKLRGTSDAIQRYTYGKVYNSQAFTACSNMPRFGHNGILTEQQMKDVTALLLDPGSPVNQ
ncbi:MAG: sulfur oxidation c-type cytochrome SoxX [Betaproteobacteria bacterium]|nr:sulfur oxidation c-type cytochrome SoxX [Betaproteobacteria bacterium]